MDAFSLNKNFPEQGALLAVTAFDTAQSLLFANLYLTGLTQRLFQCLLPKSCF